MFFQAEQDSTSSAVSSEEEHCGPIKDQPDYIRSGFIRKVYSILTIQLMITTLIVYPIVTMLGRGWVLENMSLYYLASFGSLGLVLGVSCCCQQVARTFPSNYIFLLLVTVAMSVMVGMISCFYSIGAVVQALAATAIVFFGLTAYACFTKSDFTGCGPYLFAALLAMMGFGFVMCIWSMFFGPIPSTMRMIWALLGVMLFSFYIVYDTQMIVGQGKHALGVDDYVFGALSLYLDIINMFIYMLQLFGDRR